ncbi:MAG: gamma-glutamyltransferase family protein [Planctomycetales bacterium]
MQLESEPRFNSRRSVVHATRGMVATSQPLASQAGLSVLMQGGNAADAAVACAAALNVTEPCSTGLGGDFFALYREAATGEISALNGSGRAPRALTLERLAREGITDAWPLFHAHAITVPGACAAWCDLLDRFGRLGRGTVLEPAIRLAEEGFPVAPLTARAWARGKESQLDQSPGGAELLIAGRAPRAGELMRNPTLANTLRTIAEGGSDVFYRGPIAESVASVVSEFGGTMTAEDMAAHESTWETPISVSGHGVRLHECPPNGQGLTALLALNILGCLDLPALGDPLSAPRLHHAVEAFRLAFADAMWHVTDPTFSAVPVEELLSRDYAQRRAKEIDPNRATADPKRGSPTASSDTVYFCVVDGEGNACSVVNSNYMGFGTGIVAPGTGFTLQNRGHNFSLDPKHPNALAPGKRPYHTIIPALATRESDGSLFAAMGVMGGFMQPQGHVQVFLALTLDGLDPQAALDRPRFCLEAGESRGKVALEEGISPEVLAQLQAMGHRVHSVAGHERSLFGRGQVILRDPVSGVLSAGSDPRADGCAMGF